MTDPRPNVVLIMSDEHDPATMGCYGDPLGVTPNLDALAARGVLFENAYTPCPLCQPARLAFTGVRYPSRIGAWTNSCRLPRDGVPSLADAINAAGYRSLLCGKMHFPAGERYGFEELFPCRGNSKPATGRGGRRDPDDLRPNRAQWESRAASFRAIPDEAPFRDNPASNECDAVVTQEALRFLQDPEAARQPFFLLVGYHAPHFPLEVPQSWLDRFRGRVPPPNLPTGHVESLPLNYRHRNLLHGITPDIPAQVVQRGRECYWAITAWLDHEIGKLLAGLTATPFAENTVVIYTSDHGENKGDHGMWWKSCMFEPSARVPLLVSWPHRWKGSQHRRGACSLLDLARTVGDLGGAHAHREWNGAPLTPWLDDPTFAWRDLAVSEFYASGPSGYAMLRRGRHKYVEHTSLRKDLPPERELYNLESDPGEFHNLAFDSSFAPLLSELHAALVREIGEDPEETEARCRADLARGYQAA